MMSFLMRKNILNNMILLKRAKLPSDIFIGKRWKLLCVTGVNMY